MSYVFAYKTSINFSGDELAFWKVNLKAHVQKITVLIPILFVFDDGYSVPHQYIMLKYSLKLLLVRKSQGELSAMDSCLELRDVNDDPLMYTVVLG